MTVDGISVVPELVAMNSPDSIGTYGERDEQFVVAKVRTPGASTPGRDEFALEAGGDTYAPTDPARRRYGRGLWTDGGYADPSDYVVLSVPKPLDADGIVLRWPGGERALGEDDVERLARPPTEFAVREFSAPESVESGEELTATLVVENVGEVDGAFVGALNRVGPLVAYTPVEALSLDVAAGASSTWTHSYVPSIGSSEESRSMTFRLNWRDGDGSVTTAVEPRRS